MRSSNLIRILVVLATILVAAAIQGEIVSCSSWSLNRLPEVRRFLKDSGGASIYKDLTITWKSGAKPVLYVKEDDGTVFEEISLSSMTHSELHYLMKKKGFPERTDEEVKAHEEQRKQDEKDFEAEKARVKAEKYKRMKEEEAAQKGEEL